MDEGQSLLLRMISLLLHYPEGDEPIDFLPPSSRRDTMEAFLAYQKGRPLLQLQEEYTRTFDLDPSTSLNLSFHHPAGESSRGILLLDLKRLYDQAGYENISGELPDYLPLVLEFMTVCREEQCRWICREYGPIVAALASRLEQAGSPYAGILSVAGQVFSEVAAREN